MDDGPESKPHGATHVGIVGPKLVGGRSGMGQRPANRQTMYATHAAYRLDGLDCPVNPVICDFGLAKTIKAAPDDLEAGTWVKGLSVTSAVGISYRYAAPEAFNRMYHKHGQVEEAKPVGTQNLLKNIVLMC